MKKYLLIVIATSVTLASNFAHGEQAIFECKTAKHLVRVFKEPNGVYNYKAWKTPKPPSEKPDADLSQKNAETSEGTGSCFTKYFSFKKESVEYFLRNNINYLPGHPPENAKGDLTIKINNQEKDHFWCLKQ